MHEITHLPTKKAISNLRSRLLGAAMIDPDWYRAVTSLESAIKWHDGVYRKDKVTPYILHPVMVASFVMTLPNLTRRVAAVGAALVHDVLEDTSCTVKTLADEVGGEIADEAELLSKKVEGIEKTNAQVFKGLALSDVGSICKPADRASNQSTMADVFTPEKCLSTVEFTKEWILPMMKESRRRFPRQELAYENMKFLLGTQIDLAAAMAQARMSSAVGGIERA